MNNRDGYTLKEFWDRFGVTMVAIIAAVAGLSASEVTKILEHFEHLNVIHGISSALIVIVVYILFQLSVLPSVARRLDDHSSELGEIKKSYGEAISCIKRANENNGNIRDCMEELNKTVIEIRDRISRLEGMSQRGK